MKSKLSALIFCILCSLDVLAYSKVIVNLTDLNDKNLFRKEIESKTSFKLPGTDLKCVGRKKDMYFKLAAVDGLFASVECLLGESFFSFSTSCHYGESKLGDSNRINVNSIIVGKGKNEFELMVTCITKSEEQFIKEIDDKKSER